MKNRLLDAWTLPELLVVIVLSGLIFTAMLDGAELIRHYGQYLSGRLEKSAGMLKSFRQLDLLLMRVDSVAGENGNIGLYREGQEVAVVCRQENLLISVCPRRDTLFRSVVKWEAAQDSVCLTLSEGEKTLTFCWKIQKMILP